MITHKTPKLDLHGETTRMVYPLIKEFVEYNYKTNKKELLIIHGKSTNVLTREVHAVLKELELVKCFRLDNWNIGQTIVILK